MTNFASLYFSTVLFFLVIIIFYNFIVPLLNKKHENEAKGMLGNYNAMCGMLPSGMYSGITMIPGDPNGEWTEGEKCGTCPACNSGMLTYYWQNQYYKMRCDSCGYLHDTGRKMSKEEKRQSDEMIKQIRKSENICE